MIKAVHHVAISTPDLERLALFYCEGFGFREVSRIEWPAGTEMINQVMGLPDSAALTVMLRSDCGFCLELFQFHEPVVPALEHKRPVHWQGITHLCFDVTDIEREYQRLCQLGAQFHCPPQDFGASRATYGRDLDGNVFELQELMPVG